jgi:hypothetical protein
MPIAAHSSRASARKIVTINVPMIVVISVLLRLRVRHADPRRQPGCQTINGNDFARL